MENKIIYHGVKDGLQVYTCGFPDYEGLSKAEKRALLIPLVEVIREFYKDPENRRKFEQWKAENYPNGYTEKPA